MTTDINKELEELHMNPMFRISLGSKELFHSNFLAFLWDCDKTHFLNMLNQLLPGDKQIDANLLLKKELTLHREKDNLDLCICHTENEKEYIDIIIENKVKSIPYKEQLDKYQQTANKPKHQSTTPITYILLSLASDFPNKDKIKEEWNIVSYKNLANAIEQNYIENGNLADKLKQYVKDYIDFITKLSSLDILGNFEKEPFHNSETISAYHAQKLSDLYLKQRGSYFICSLMESLSKKEQQYFLEVKVNFFTDSNWNSRRKAEKNTIIWLSSGMNRGKSTITICINPSNSKNLYEIQIEGDQYRHILNQEGLVAKRATAETHLNEMPFFAIDQLPEDLQTDNWQGRNTYNQYKPDCLYKYVNYQPKITGKQMQEYVIQDVVNILGYLQQCESIVNTQLVPHKKSNSNHI